jgi:hypothetical protein
LNRFAHSLVNLGPNGAGHRENKKNESAPCAAMHAKPEDLQIQDTDPIARALMEMAAVE